MKESISSQNMTNPIRISTFLLFYVGYYLGRSTTCSLVTYSDQFIFSILLQHHISKLSKYFCSSFLIVQVSEQYKAMLQTYHLTNFFLNPIFSLLIKSDIFLLNACLTLAILILISLVQNVSQANFKHRK